MAGEERWLHFKLTWDGGKANQAWQYFEWTEIVSLEHSIQSSAEVWRASVVNMLSLADKEVWKGCLRFGSFAVALGEA